MSLNTSLAQLYKLIQNQYGLILNGLALLILAWVILLSLSDWFANPLPKSAQINVLPALPTLRDWHLVGVYQTPPRAAVASQLPFQLVGVMLASEADKAQAIIAVIGGPEKVYYIGDSLPGGVVLQEILPDAVLLQHNNRLEKLAMPVSQLDWLDPPRGFNG